MSTPFPDSHPSRSWPGPRVSVRHSEVEGDGLFATAPIATGEVVMIVRGTIIDDRQLAELRPHSSLAIAEDLNLVQGDDDPSQYGNHSYDPNLWLAGATTVTSRRDIVLDAELTIDDAVMTVA